ncbi:MAG: DUF4139 domain-containing protein [Marinilabiliales bacterium]|nr:DUF4139 domain-containing protein [Marinilabiliales bacterium]
MIRGLATKSAAKSEMPVARDEEMAIAYEAAEAPSVSISTGTTTISFDVTVPSDIMSEGQIKTIEIGRTTTDASFVYESVPKLDQKAFLTGRIANWEDLNIIGGCQPLF